MTALIAFLAASLIGLGLFCAGVFVLAGAGWALLAGSASLLFVAAFIRRGMIDG